MVLPKQIVDGNILTDAKGIVNAFNKYFASVGPMVFNLAIEPLFSIITSITNWS